MGQGPQPSVPQPPPGANGWAWSSNRAGVVQVGQKLEVGQGEEEAGEVKGWMVGGLELKIQGTEAGQLKREVGARMGQLLK